MAVAAGASRSAGHQHGSTTGNHRWPDRRCHRTMDIRRDRHARRQDILRTARPRDRTRTSPLGHPSIQHTCPPATCTASTEATPDPAAGPVTLLRPPMPVPACTARLGLDSRRGCQGLRPPNVVRGDLEVNHSACHPDTSSCDRPFLTAIHFSDLRVPCKKRASSF
jgi:hypothetical protein